MNIREYGVFFWTVVGIFALLLASPALSRVLVYPRTEFFTELWLLGPSHKAEGYPYNVSRGAKYTVYLGVGNQLGYLAYYQVRVKFRNESQLGPTSFGPEGTRVPSNVSSLFNLSVFVGDLQVWEEPVTFSFDYAYDDIAQRVDFISMAFNDVGLDMSGRSVVWNASKAEYSGTLFFETWLYRNATLGFAYHERFVSLRLNMTA